MIDNSRQWGSDVVFSFYRSHNRLKKEPS